MAVIRAILCLCLAWSAAAQQVIFVQGSAGAPEYEKDFRDQASAWQAAATAGKASFVTVLPATEDQGTRIAAALKQAPSDKPLWLVLAGHGTFDGRKAKFNIAGPDLDPDALAKLLTDRKAETVVVAGFTASGAFVKPLAAPNRIIVAATQNALELSYSRFGSYFAEAIAGGSDLDQDKTSSVLEAFLHACHQVNKFYESAGRICTEHAILDDNGDGIGTRSEGFEGLRPLKATDDGRRAHQQALVLSSDDAKLSEEQRRQRDALELEVQKIIDQRTQLGDAVYYQRIEPLFRKLAEIGR